MFTLQKQEAQNCSSTSCRYSKCPQKMFKTFSTCIYCENLKTTNNGNIYGVDQHSINISSVCGFRILTVICIWLFAFLCNRQSKLFCVKIRQARLFEHLIYAKLNLSQYGQQPFAVAKHARVTYVGDLQEAFMFCLVAMF